MTQPDPVNQSLQQHIAFLEQEAARLQTAIHDHIDRPPGLRQDRDLLRSIPAVGEKTASRLLAILQSRAFQSADQRTLDDAVDGAVSDQPDLRPSTAPATPPANLGQSLAGFPASTEKALLLKQIRLT